MRAGYAGAPPRAAAPSRSRRPTGWPPWTAPVALVGGLVLAAVGGLIVDIPALAFGVKITSSHMPPGLEIADTVVQDVGVRARGGATARTWAGARCARGSSGCAARASGWRAAAA